MWPERASSVPAKTTDLDRSEVEHLPAVFEEDYDRHAHIPEKSASARLVLLRDDFMSRRI